ncbi:MAG: hypothetical protein HYR51_05655 [Candidatus Rokubacteria bacterium]|nr:hypothetical protein [Candidatus Rokubacteria bacterium]
MPKRISFIDSRNRTKCSCSRNAYSSSSCSFQYARSPSKTSWGERRAAIAAFGVSTELSAGQRVLYRKPPQRIFARLELTPGSASIGCHNLKVVDAVVGHDLAVDDYALVPLDERAHEFIRRGDVLIQITGMSRLERTTPAPDRR